MDMDEMTGAILGLKQFRIKFCWAQRFPFTVVLDGIPKEVPPTPSRTIAFMGPINDGVLEMLKRLKGTDPKVISNINNITICQS